MFGSLISLVTGTLCFYAIMLWVQNERSMDRFHENSENIYIITSQRNPMSGPRPSILESYIDQSSLPGLKQKLVTRTYTENEVKLSFKNKDYDGKGMVVDSTFFDFFDFKVIDGNRDVLLRDASHIVITQSFAKRIFGQAEPIGQTIKLELDQSGDYIVQGVLEDIPSNSSFGFDFLVPTHSQSWWGRMAAEFVLTEKNFDRAQFDSKIVGIGRVRRGYEESVISTYPLTDVYFEKPFEHSFFDKTGDYNSVVTLTVIGLVILLISILNFTNIQATHMISQIKTRGIKRVNGASKFDIYVELILSRVFYALISAIICLAVFNAILPYYENFLNISIETNLVNNLILFFGISLASTLLSIVFLFYNSSTKASAGNLIGERVKSEAGVGKKVLTTVQYTCAIVLIIASIVIYQQFNYMVNKDIGYNYKDVVSVKLLDDIPQIKDRTELLRRMNEVKNNYQLILSESQSNPNFEALSQGELPIGSSAYAMSWKLVGGPEEYTNQYLMTVDPGYLDLLGLELVQGRFFSEELDEDREKKLVVNEAALRYWGIKDISSARIANGSWGGKDDPYQIIGVVKDYHFQHLSRKVEPLMLSFMRDPENNFVYRLNSQNRDASLGTLRELFQKINPNKAFDYTLLEDRILLQYEREKKLSQIFLVFMIVGLLLSTVGLFTFALFETQKRIKEIGIRKVLGASIESIMSLLSISFLKWIVLSFIFACPIAWYFLSGWLDNFASRVSLNWTVFVFSGFATILIAMLTIFWQTQKSAKRNPVEALRYE